MMRIKNEERWIRRALDSVASLVEGIVVLDDGSTDSTPELCRSHAKVVRYEYRAESKLDEVRDKNRLLGLTMELDPDWIIALDGDEALESRATQVISHEIDRIDRMSPVLTHFLVNVITMWKDDRHYVPGECWMKRIFTTWSQEPRTLRFEYKLGHGSGFHCGSIPTMLRGPGKKVDVWVQHLGYMSRQDRDRKYSFYMHNDPEVGSTGYYDHLLRRRVEVKEWTERTVADGIHEYPIEEYPTPPSKRSLYRRILDGLPQRYKRPLRTLKYRLWG